MKAITPRNAVISAIAMGFEESETALYEKGGKRFLISRNNEAQIILNRSERSGAYRNSKKSIPVGFPQGLYATKSEVDVLDLDFVKVVKTYSKNGHTLVAD